MEVVNSSSLANLDPRIAERRRSVYEQDSKRRRYRLAAVATLLLIVAASVGVLYSPLFSARTVVIDGAKGKYWSSIMRVSGLSSHPPLIEINAHSVVSRLDTLPYLASATLQRRWPSTVVLTVTQRVPVAAIRYASGPWATVSSSGRIIALHGLAPKGLPVIYASKSADVSVGSSVGSGFSAALSVATTVERDRVDNVQEIHLTSNGEVQLVLNHPAVTVELGGAHHVRAKLTAIETLENSNLLVKGEVVNVSTPSVPVLSFS